MADEDEKNLFAEENLFPTQERPQITVRPRRELPVPEVEENLFRTRPPAEMRSYERSWSQKMGDAYTDLLQAGGASRGTSMDLGRRLSNVTTLIPPIGMAVGGADAIYHGDRGNWVDAGVNALSVIPGGKYVSEALQAGRVARGASPARAPLREGEALGVERQMPEVPSTQAHFDEGDRLFKEFRDTTNVKFKPAPVMKMTDDMLKEFQATGHYVANPGDKPIFTAVEALREKALTNGHLTAADFDEFRQALSRVSKTPGAPAQAAQEAQEKLFNYLEATGNPQLQKAVQNWKYAHKGEVIDTILEKADISAGTKGVETQSRVALNAKATQKWTDAEREVLTQARKGPWQAQALDKTADILTGRQGGLGGVAAVAPAMTGGMGLAGYLGLGPYGAALAAVPGVAATTAGMVSPVLKGRAVQEAGNVIRSGSPMYKDIVAANTPTYKVANPMAKPPGTADPGADWVRRNAIAQALMEQEGYR